MNDRTLAEQIDAFVRIMDARIDKKWPTSLPMLGVVTWWPET